MKNIRGLVIALAVFLMSAAVATAQRGPNFQVSGGSSNTKVTVKTGSKPSQTATVSPGTYGGLTLPAELEGPDKPHSQMREWDCDNGDVYIVPEGDPDPCPHKGRRGIVFWWDTRDTVMLHPQTPSATATHPMSPPSSQTSMGTTGAGIQFQLRGFGGASFVNGNTPGTAGFDGAVLFPLGNRISIGPTAGFQWINSTIVNSIGSQQPGSTFIHTSAGFKQGNFGGGFFFHVPGAHVHAYPWTVGLLGGATVAGSTISQAIGFCGGIGGSLPPGCTIFSSTTTHDTLTSPFVGGYISHSIFSHVGVFVGYNYHFGLTDTKPNPTNPTGPRVSILDLHYSDAVAGITLTFGRHEK